VSWLRLDRRGVAGRRPDRRPRRHVPWGRLAGIAGVLATSTALYWLTTDPAFAVDAGAITVDGLRFTDLAAVRGRTGLAPGARPNAFRVAARDLEADLADLPTVLAADVRVALPNTLTIEVVERVPILVWRSGASAWLVDRDGDLFASADEVSEGERGDGSLGSPLPAIDDRRADGAWGVGTSLDALDLEVARLLGALTPAALGSGLDRLFVALDPAEGYLIEAPGAWRAVFGSYTPTLRPPDVIPQQVQCLAALLADRERAVAEVTLSLGPDRCGTFRGGRTPAPAARPIDGGAGVVPDRTPGRRPGGRATPRP
jgi:hypothetical protein